MHAAEYVRDVLVGGIGVHAVVIGYDHRFGRNREGDLRVLHQYGEAYDFAVEEIPAQEVDHVKVSSTKIRQALLDGDVITANEQLGYSYSLTGVVVKGDQLGRTLGYPTANFGGIDPFKLIPGDGVYVVQVELRDGRFGGMLYIGERPTLQNPEPRRSVEVYIFGLDRDLYGEAITVRFMEQVRGDMRFDGLDALKGQMQLDEVFARQRLGL